MNLTLTDEQADRLLNELEWSAWQMATLFAGFDQPDHKKMRPLRERLFNLKALSTEIRKQREQS